MSDDEQSYNPYAEEIKRLASELRGLSVETRSISDRLHGLQQSQREGRRARSAVVCAEAASKKKPNDTFQVGVRVKVTNNYRGAKGTTGVIVKVTPSTVIIKTDNGDSDIRRFKENIAHIE
jgi:hypothetical protein